MASQLARTAAAYPALLERSSGRRSRVLDLALAGELVVAYDDRVLSEWREVLGRGKFGFSSADVGSLLALIEAGGARDLSPHLAASSCPTRTICPFLEVAREAGATLVTGNAKHYPPDLRRGVEVIGPRRVPGGMGLRGRTGRKLLKRRRAEPSPGQCRTDERPQCGFLTESPVLQLPS